MAAKKTAKAPAKKTARKATGRRTAAARRAAEQEADDRSLQNMLGGGPHPDDVAKLAARREGKPRNAKR